MIDVSCQASRSRFKTRFWAENEFARDKVDFSVRCLLVVRHLARLSRFRWGRPRPYSRRLPASRAVFVLFCKRTVLISSVYS